MRKCDYRRKTRSTANDLGVENQQDLHCSWPFVYSILPSTSWGMIPILLDCEYYDLPIDKGSLENFFLANFKRERRDSDNSSAAQAPAWQTQVFEFDSRNQNKQRKRVRLRFSFYVLVGEEKF